MKGKITNLHNGIKRQNVEIGESIEEKMRRVTEVGEPIDNAMPMVYTELKDGVLPEYDYRTDRWDIAQKAMDIVNKQNYAKTYGTTDSRSDGRSSGEQPSEQS